MKCGTEGADRKDGSTSPHHADQASKRAAQTSALALAGTRQLGVGIAFQRGFQVFATVLLARLLLPGDFGLMTVAVVTFEAANMLRELGMSNALIHRRDRIQESADILFIAGWALSGILFATVAPSAHFFPAGPETRERGW